MKKVALNSGEWRNHFVIQPIYGLKKKKEGTGLYETHFDEWFDVIPFLYDDRQHSFGFHGVSEIFHVLHDQRQLTSDDHVGQAIAAPSRLVQYDRPGGRVTMARH